MVITWRSVLKNKFEIDQRNQKYQDVCSKANNAIKVYSEADWQYQPYVRNIKTILTEIGRIIQVMNLRDLQQNYNNELRIDQNSYHDIHDILSYDMNDLNTINIIIHRVEKQQTQRIKLSSLQESLRKVQCAYHDHLLATIKCTLEEKRQSPNFSQYAKEMEQAYLRLNHVITIYNDPTKDASFILIYESEETLASGAMRSTIN